MKDLLIIFGEFVGFVTFLAMIYIYLVVFAA